MRLSLCCGHCRRRTLPLSVLYWGRRVYWGVVMLVISALRQGGGYTVRRLDHLFAVSRSTLERWRRYFHEVFPLSRCWQRLRGRLLPVIVPQDLPWGLIERFLKPRSDPLISLVTCLKALKMPFL